MVVEYERTLDDLIWFNQFHIAHSPSIKRQILLWRISFSLLTVFLSLGVMYLISRNKPLSYLAYTISVIGGFFIFLIYPSLNRSSIIRRTRKLLSEGDNKPILGHQTITVLPEGLFCKTYSGESRLNWSSIHKIEGDKTYIFLYISAINAIIIPKRAFLTKKSEEEFMNLIDIYRRLI